MNYLRLLLVTIALTSGFYVDSLAQNDSPKIKVAQPIEYVRLYSDSLGESHFEDLEFSFDLVDFAPPAPPISVSQIFHSDKFLIISSPPDWYGGWHPAPQKQFFIPLTGTLEVTVSDGEVRRFGPNTLVLVEDTFGKGHTSRVVGDLRVYAVIAAIEE